jgi:hypothetical protein
MNSDELRTWIHGLLWSQKMNKKIHYPKTFSNRNKAYKTIRLSSKSVSIFQNIIFETIHKIGKASHGNHIFKINMKINHNHIIRNFIHFKFLNTCVWMFRFRKYFSKFKLYQTYLKTGSINRGRL